LDLKLFLSFSTEFLMENGKKSEQKKRHKKN